MISVFIRTTLMFFLVIFTMRLMGKKSLGEFQPSDLVSVMLISNLTSIVIEAPELPIIYSVVPIVLITCYEIFMSVAVRKNKVVSKLAQGKSMILIRKGIIDQKVMEDLRFTVSDVLEGMRSKDIFYLEEINLAIVETTGSISVYPDPNVKSNLKKADIPPFAVITDGELNKNNMSAVNCTDDYIKTIMKRENTDIKNTLLLLIDGAGQYHLTVKEQK